MAMNYPHPLELEVADRLANIVAGGDDTDIEDFADLLRLRGIGLRDTMIAKSLHRALRMRGQDTALLLAVPDGLSLEFVERETWNWRAFAARDGRLPMDFLDVACSVRHWYADVIDRLHELSAADQLEPRSHVRAPSLEPTDGNIYSLDEYRRMRA